VVNQEKEDVESLSMWLANVCRMTNNLEQYSGERTYFEDGNMRKQNWPCLRHFNLVEIKQIFSNLRVQIFDTLVATMRGDVSKLVLPAIIGSSEIIRSSRASGELSVKLSKYFSALSTFGVESEIIVLLFRNLFWYLGAKSFNRLINEKNLCQPSATNPIRVTVDKLLNNWAYENNLPDVSFCDFFSI
jgi:hypothetical protein